MAHHALFRFLDTVGNGSGDKEATVDGSSTPVVFRISPPGRHTYHIARLITLIEDANAMASNTYGNISSLANGLTIQLCKKVDGSVIIDFTGGLPIKKNSDWARFSYDIKQDEFATGNKFLVARWSFALAGGNIDVSPDEFLGITINDDLTGLNSHTFQVQGRDFV